MQISDDSLLQKMQQALHQVQNSQSPHEAATHLANIKLLSELWLEAYNKRQGKRSEEMLPEKKEHASQSVQHAKVASPSISETDPEEDDFSIFDF